MVENTQVLSRRLYFSVVKFIVCIVLLFCSHIAAAQSISEGMVFKFLRLPNTAQLAALGDYNVSQITEDAGMAVLNPAMLRQTMNKKADIVFRTGIAGMKNMNLAYTTYASSIESAISFSVQYFNYGNTPATDLSGNITGNFHPVDYIVQTGFSRQYLQKWHYGGNVKFIHSGYGSYTASGLAIDAGLNYYDSSKGFQAGLLLRNMGIQLASFTGSEKSPLPFDMLIGVSKKLKDAPVQLSVTAHSLNDFSLLENYHAVSGRKNDFEEALAHLVWAAQVYAGRYIELSASYGHLRGFESGVIPYAKGLTGLNFGVGVLLKRMQLRYSSGIFQPGTSRHYMGIGINFY